MQSYIYLMANNHNTTLYVGVTGNLIKRVWEHKSSVDKRSFTYQYNCYKLVHYEIFVDIRYAIAREKQLKNWKREWKNELVEKGNPCWRDLWEDIAGYPAEDPGSSPG